MSKWVGGMLSGVYSDPDGVLYALRVRVGFNLSEGRIFIRSAVGNRLSKSFSDEPLEKELKPVKLEEVLKWAE